MASSTSINISRPKGSSQNTLGTEENSKIKFAFDGDENEERGNWTGKLDFLLSCIGFAVGLGNVWRFPYLCGRNGGGAFLIPYALMLALAGLPLFLFELILGQYSSLGPISIWQISPMFKGLGYAMITISGMVCIYYNMIIAYTLFYFFASFTSKLPWSHCNNDFNTGNCSAMGSVVDSGSYNCTPYVGDNGTLYDNGTAYFGDNGTLYSNGTAYFGDNGTLFDNCTSSGGANDTSAYYVGDNGTLYATGTNLTWVPVSPAEEYWKRYVLDLSDGIDNLGHIRWQLALCLLLAWVVVFLCLSKGIKSTGKVVYFTALFPYVVLICLLCRGATLGGSLDGIKFYIIPEWEKLKEPKVWGDAAIQIFYSLGPAWGGLITMSSYNRFNNNCYRDAIIVAITNCGTSVFAGFVIFSVIGHMAHELQVDIAEVAASGPGLAFVAYPAGIALMPEASAPFWAIIFFFMLFTLGLDSLFAMMETVITALCDEFASLRKHKVWFTLAICVLFYLLGLPQCTQGGFYILQLMDWYSAGFSLLITAFFEIVVVMLIYGYKRFADDFYCMVGFRPNVYWRVTWIVITPLTLLFIIGFNAWQHVPCYLEDYVLPDWAQGLGWAMVAAALFWLPFWALIVAGQKTHSQFPTLKRLLAATPEWRPALEEHQAMREAIRENNKSIQNGNGTSPPAYSDSDYHANPAASKGAMGYDNPSIEATRM